jgi:colanic acid/amylovoran biosynthesis glycosyltransferase
MKNICIVTLSTNTISETFIQAHIEMLKGNITLLYGNYPDYIFDNKQIRFFYRTNTFLNKFKKLIPFFIYTKYILPIENSHAVIEEYITEFLKQKKIDVILAEYGNTGAQICKYAKKLSIPVIVHFHGVDAHHEQYYKSNESGYKLMFDYANTIISVSNVMTRRLISIGAKAEKIVLNPYGPRPYFYDIQSGYENILLAIGRFAETKAPHITLTAFANLLKKFPEAQLVMVGDGPLRESCVNLAEALGIAGKVTFTGAIRHENILPYLKKACCFVQHSITTVNGDSEGTPVAILEAQAAGLPVVATRHAGIMEAVVHEQTGILVDEKDITAMSEAMLRLISDKELCRTMGANAREHIRKNYTIEKHLNCIQNLIDNCNTKN